MSQTVQSLRTFMMGYDMRAPSQRDLSPDAMWALSDTCDMEMAEVSQ